ncbi:hypothetical protein EV702DRAFT_1253492 [Suillus placidus]|uniref:Sortilin C-terminal domain-containing protein n=1 Tax=Suillus placidus TaxID=48579 RepID=A0A9P7CXL5_9AGAM|nr:hypothetical protein EV702DRAFT_1253492 [Suillus placidus]
MVYLTRHTRIYVPLTPYLLPIISSTLTASGKPKSSTLRPLDMETHIHAPAQPRDVENSGQDDFELWSPSEERDSLCLFGQQTLYHRRKRDVNCVVGNTPKALDNVVRNCTCTLEDFECEFNYVRNGEGECVLVTRKDYGRKRAASSLGWQLNAQASHHQSRSPNHPRPSQRPPHTPISTTTTEPSSHNALFPSPTQHQYLSTTGVRPNDTGKGQRRRNANAQRRGTVG